MDMDGYGYEKLVFKIIYLFIFFFIYGLFLINFYVSLLKKKEPAHRL